MINNKFHFNNFLTPPSTELSPFLMADNQLAICNGVNLTYKKGIIIKDLGYSKVGTTLEASKSITGLHNFRQSSSVQKILATVNNAAGTNLTLQYNNAGTWTDITLGGAWDTYEDTLVEFEDFIGYCFMVGYDSTDSVFLPVASLTGTTFSTSTNVTDMPDAKYIKRYRDRLYIANCQIGATNYPYRVYFSSVPAAGSISWTVATDFIDVDYSEEITGIGTNWDRLVIFTEFSAYLYDQVNKKQSWDVGCVNNRTIQNIGPYMIWADKYNVWASTGGRPTPIGNDILELISESTPSNWRSAVVDDEYHLYLGSTSANGLSYSNLMLIFNTGTGSWRWRELYDGVTELTRYTSSSVDYLYLGVNDGMVHVKSKRTDTTPIYTDDGNPIVAHFRTKAYDLGDPSVMKTINRIVTYCNRGQGLTFRYRVWDKNQEVVMPWTDIGQLSSVVKYFDGKITGNFIQFEGKEMGKNQSFEFYGFTAQLGVDSKL